MTQTNMFETAKTKVSILDVYKKYFDVKSIKTNGKGETIVTCPFHDDKRPSMYLYPNNTFHCFGCGENGTAIDLVMKALGVDSKTAAKRICDDFSLPYQNAYENRNRWTEPTLTESEREHALLVLERMKDIFKAALASAPEPDYFAKRGLGELVEEFELGYCPVGARIKSEVTNDIRNLGLFGGDLRCAFGGRYIVPIKDMYGKVRGFIGRASKELEESGAPKYIISQNSDVFNKRGFMFNASVLRDPSYDEINVVEGVFDALSFIAAGMRNVVCCFGNSISDRQLNMLSKKTITLAFDDDEAGRTATRKAVGYIRSSRVRIGTFGYMGHKDANEMLVAEGKEALALCASASKPAPSYLIMEAIDDGSIGTEDGQDRLWILLAKHLGSNIEGYREAYPINPAYTPMAAERYWNEFDSAVGKGGK